MTTELQRWPHQTFAVREIVAGVEAGRRKMLLCSPTGGGKSIIACDTIDHFVELNWSAVLYTNRRMLTEQLAGVLRRHGIDFGVRAAGWSDEGRFEPVQISSLPTERRRTLDTGQWNIHGLGRKCLAVVDEAHLNNGPTAKEIFRRHAEAGHTLLGITATPIGLGDTYDHLIVAGTNSELRTCGALVPSFHYGPDEPDTAKIGRFPLGEDLTEKQNRSAMGEAGTQKFYNLSARVRDWFLKLNGEQLPTILFAPGVPESIGFAEDLTKHGIPAAHLDGGEIWRDGQTERASPGARKDLLAAFQAGEIKVLCNRFVLREGIDIPFAVCGIFGCVFGSLQSYLQAGGRLLRACQGKDHAIIIDFGGNWWRHGSLNEDRHWRLEYTAGMVAGLREEAYRNPKEQKPAEPMRCPKCSKIVSGPRCPVAFGGCGWEVPAGCKKSRPVIQADGKISEYTGDIFKQRRVTNKPDAEKIWEKMYHRGKRAGMTFRQCEALFAMENNWGYPPRNLPLMPTSQLDWFLPVGDVPKERLTPKA